MISGSTTAFILAQMPEGLPARAFSASWAIIASRSDFRVIGEKDSRSSRSGWA